MKFLKNWWLKRPWATREAPSDEPAGWFKFSNARMAERADYIICCLESEDPKAFDDNLVGKCCRCKKPIIYRADAPRKPKKICMPCVQARTQEWMNSEDN